MLQGVHDPIYFPESIEEKLFLALDDLFRNSWVILGDSWKVCRMWTVLHLEITCGNISGFNELCNGVSFSTKANNFGSAGILDPFA